MTHLLVENQVRVHGTSGAVRIQSKGRCQMCGTVGIVIIAAAVAAAVVIVGVLSYERQNFISR